jgi:mannose/fructose/N-acetylgalactosamine-specific phosphotransferase system component IIC
MLWSMLTVSSSLAFIAGATLSVRDAGLGFPGQVVAIIVGVILAVCNVLVMKRIGNATANYATQAAEQHTAASLIERRLGLVYILALAWLFAAVFLGEVVTSASIQLIRQAFPMAVVPALNH